MAATIGFVCYHEGVPVNDFRYLSEEVTLDLDWDDPWFSAPGFPRVFYLRYHGYSTYFPLWALARYCRHADQRWR